MHEKYNEEPPKSLSQEDKVDLVHSITDKFLGGKGMTNKYMGIKEGPEEDKEQGKGFTMRPKDSHDEDQSIKLEDNLKAVEMRPGATNIETDSK